MERVHTIRLRPGEQDRLLAGHPWVYQNELEGWPPDAAPGDLVDLHDSQGHFLGRGYLNPRTIIARNDSPMREREGLPRERAILRGQIPPEPTVTINGLDVTVDLLEGQKTGLFLDQIDNYPLIERMAGGADVLDCFCYVGLWSLHAARYGATRVTGIDQSPAAVKQATALAERNGLADRCVFRVANAFDELRERDRRREAFDLVILDPPAFVKARNRIPEALAGYKEINLRAMRLLRPGGFLVTCSCSYHLSGGQFRHIRGRAT